MAVSSPTNHRLMVDMDFTVNTIESNCTVWESRKQNLCNSEITDGIADCDNHTSKTGKATFNQIWGDSNKHTVYQL